MDDPIARKAKVRKESVLNEACFKRFVLGKVAALRPAWKPDRIAKSFVEKWEAKLRAQVTAELLGLPSKGKTIK